MDVKKFLIFLCSFLGITVQCARILQICHVPNVSHHVLGVSILKSLAAKGHNVTMVSPFPLKEKIPNYRDIYMEGVDIVYERIRKGVIDWHNLSNAEVGANMFNFTQTLAETTLKSKAMQYLLQSEENFDVVILDPFGNEAFFGLGHHFNASIIVLSTATSQYANHLVGNVAPFSFVPNVMTPYSDRMSFIERFFNTITGLIMYYNSNNLAIPAQKKLYNEIFKHDLPFEIAIKSSSLILVNTHPLFESVRPYLPNMIQIAGAHLSEPKQLPEDIQQYLDEAKEGVIFFSIGSCLHSKHMSQKTINIILQTFAKLPQKVLWKFEDENLAGKPDNVKIGKWFSQTDILAHPNVKLFITHGGLLSCIETVYNAVPVVGIPFYTDQFQNVAHFQRSNYGVQLLFNELTEETFSNTINEVLYNPKYCENIQRASKLFKDQPMKPLDKAIFWIEYVIRNKGASHFRSASMDLTLYQYLLLDIVAVVVLMLGIFLLTIYFGIKIAQKSFKRKNSSCKIKQK